MARYFLLVTAILLLLAGLVVAGYGVRLLVADDGAEASGGAALFETRIFGSGEGSSGRDDPRTVQAASLFGFAVLSLILGAVLLAAGASGRDDAPVVQQQQQVVVVTDRDARVETRRTS